MRIKHEICSSRKLPSIQYVFIHARQTQHFVRGTVLTLRGISLWIQLHLNFVAFGFRVNAASGRQMVRYDMIEWTCCYIIVIYLSPAARPIVHDIYTHRKKEKRQTTRPKRYYAINIVY